MKLFITLDLETKDVKPSNIIVINKLRDFSLEMIKEYAIPTQLKITNLPVRKS